MGGGELFIASHSPRIVTEELFVGGIVGYEECLTSSLVEHIFLTQVIDKSQCCLIVAVFLESRINRVAEPFWLSFKHVLLT